MRKQKRLAIAALALAAWPSAHADPVDEACKMVYMYYYTPFDKRSGASDAAIAQIQCLTAANEIAETEVINYDVQTLLQRAKIEPDNYRKVIANGIQFACVRNTMKIKGFTYSEFKRSQCGELRPQQAKPK